VPVPGQWQSNLAPSTPRGMGARTNPNTVVSRGCPIVCQRGVGSRFTPRPVVPCVRSPNPDNSVSKDNAVRNTMSSQAMEIPSTPTKRYEVWAPAAKQGRPDTRKSRSLSNKGARYSDVSFPSNPKPETPRQRRSVRWDQSIQQEILEDRVQTLEQQVRELTMSKLEEVRPDSPINTSEQVSEVSYDHFLHSSLTSSPSFDHLVTVGSNTPSFPHHAESPTEGSLACSPASPAPSCTIASPNGEIISPLQEFGPGSSSNQPFECQSFDSDENSQHVDSELAAEIEVLKAQVATLCSELTECKHSKLQVEKSFRETTLEYQRSMKVLLLQLEKAETIRTKGCSRPKLSSSNGVRTPR